VVNASPQQSDLARAEWLPVRPGTDAALMLGLATTLVEEGLHDTAFLARCTSGWPALRGYLLGEADGQTKSAEWAAPICDIPAGTIRALARDMARERTMITLAWGLQRADHGEMTLWAGLALAAMLGQIGQPGTGFGFGYGSTAPVGRPGRLLPWPSLPQGTNPVADFIPVARIADMLLNPGGTYSYNGATRHYPDARLVWWAGGNPFHHHQDLNRLERAWARPETVIVQDHSWSATARRADIVLPATSPLERTDIMMNRRDPSLIFMSPLCAPPEDALDDHEILRRIAGALGFEAAFTEGRDVEGWLRWLWERAGKVAREAGLPLPDFDRFREIGRVDIPGDNTARVLLGDFVRDPERHPLGTESGRIALAHAGIAAMDLDDCPGHPAWLRPAENLVGAPAGALHLISQQPDTRLHSQNERGSEAQKSKIAGREPCRMHPEAAAARGIAEGSVVRLFNARGACLAGVRLDPGLRRDCVVLATGAWFDPALGADPPLEVAGNPNVLTLDKGASGLSQGNIAQTALVFAEPWQGALPPLSTDCPPPLRNSPGSGD
jgi:biotin/methionine sulfoxide reductase